MMVQLLLILMVLMEIVMIMLGNILNGELREEGVLVNQSVVNCNNNVEDVVTMSNLFSDYGNIDC